MSHDAARALVGGLLLASAEQLEDVRRALDLVLDADIHAPDVRIVFGAIRDAVELDGAVDVGRVRIEAGQRGGPGGEWYTAIMEQAVTSANIAGDAVLVVRESLERDEKRAAHALASSQTRESAAGARAELNRIAERRAALDGTAGDDLPRIYAIGEIDKMDLPTIETLIDRLMCVRDRLLLFGNAGSGKTFLALRLSYILATGIRRHLVAHAEGKLATFEIGASMRHYRVLYVVGADEAGWSRIQARSRTIATELEIDLEKADVHFVCLPTTFDPFTTVGARKMRRILENAKIQGGVVVLDNLFALSAFDLSDQGQAARVWACTADWRTKFDLAGMVVVAHPRKSGPGEGDSSGDRMYGSARSTAAAEAILELVKAPTKESNEPGAPRQVTFYVHKTRDGADGWAKTYCLDGARGRFIGRSSAEGAASPGGLTEQVLYLALRSHANANPLVGWNEIHAAINALLTRLAGEERTVSVPTVRRFVERVLLEPPTWLWADKVQRSHALALARADGTRWIETDGDLAPFRTEAEDHPR